MENSNNVIPFTKLGLLSLPQVLALIPVSRSGWYQGIKDGLYPCSVRVSANRVAWRAEDIFALIEELSNQDGGANA